MITALKIYTPYYFTSFEYSFNSLFIAAFGKFIQETLDILWYAVIIGAIGSWFMSYNAHPMFTLIDEMCEPFYKPIRKILPVMTGIDFSPIILLIAINLLQMIILPPIFYLTKFF
jgi:YggT family protein